MIKFTRFAQNSLISFMILWLVSSSLVYASESSKSPVGWSNFALGDGINLAVKEDGTVWSWGGNTYGQLGNGESGSGKSAKSPVQVKGLIDVIAVAAGQINSLALKKDGTVWAWGSNHYGNIGDGTISKYDEKSGAIIIDNDKHTPIQVPGLTDVKQIIQDWVNSYAVKQDGTIWAWGEFYGTKPTQLTQWKQVASISVGYASDLLVLKEDGTVWQLGTIDGAVYNGQKIPPKRTPQQVQGLSNIVAIANGAGCYFALQNNGRVWSWGNNHNGQLGDGTNTDRSDPSKINAIDDVIDIKATAGGPLYLKKDGTVWGNGHNSGGQLGIGSYEDKNVPIKVKDLVKIKKITATGINSRAMAIRQDGVLFSWGSGLTGDGTEWWSTTPNWIKSNDSEIFETDPILVKVNGKGLYFDQPPVTINGRTMVPLRKIFESMGIDITWNSSTSTITASRGNSNAVLSIDNQIAKVDGEAKQLDSPPVIINGRTLVPVRFVAEAFGAEVGWDQSSRTVSITLNGTKITDTDRLPVKQDNEQAASTSYMPTALNVQFVPSQNAELMEAKAKPLEKLLTNRLGIPVKVSVSTDYKTIIEGMASKKVDISFLPPYTYILAHDTRKVADVLLQALRYGVDDVTGQPTKDLVNFYNSMILIKSDSPIKTIADLRGKKIGWQGKASAAGYVYPGALLKKNGIDPEIDVQGSVFQGHDRAVLALLNDQVDAVGVFQDIRTLMLKDYPNIMKDTRVLTYADKIPNDTISIRSDMDSALKKKIQDTFIAIGQDPEGQKVIFNAFMHNGYIASDDKNFDVVREVIKLMGIK